MDTKSNKSLYNNENKESIKTNIETIHSICLLNNSNLNKQNN